MKKIINTLDSLLDQITMYRLVLYYLIGLLVVATIYSTVGILSYNPLSIIGSSLFLVAICYVTNMIFAKVFKVPTNVESVYITALILACIFTPLRGVVDLQTLAWAGVLAMASKYILTIKKQHLFNPVAIAALLLFYGANTPATWWIGNAWLTPFIMIGGFLLLRKTQRITMVLVFYLVALTVITLFTLVDHNPIKAMLEQVFLHSSFFFFAYVMLTEPQTTPATNNRRLLYAGLVGLLFPPQIHLGSLYSTPELALVVGNIFSFLISPKQKFVLQLQEKLQIAPGIMDFVFKPQGKMQYVPGQYMEWTLQHPHTDSRGNRRYFTLASSPTEESLRLGVRFDENGSSYKKALQLFKEDDQLVAGQLMGDFVLPKDQTKKLVFVAGGIGITPFRSILKYLIDSKEKRDIVVIYSNKLAEDIVYADVLQEAQKSLGIKTVYTVTDKEHVPSTWKGRVGRINTSVLTDEIPDFKERTFYLSGPHAMVMGFEQVLSELNVSPTHIRKDFFPGF